MENQDSRSVVRRKAIQQGKPMPKFSGRFQNEFELEQNLELLIQQLNDFDTVDRDAVLIQIVHNQRLMLKLFHEHHKGYSYLHD